MIAFQKRFVPFRSSILHASNFFARYKYLIVILVLAVAARVIWLKLTVNLDEGELGYDAMRWLRGEIPYGARLSEKPPLAYIIYTAAIFFFGNSVIPIRVFNDALFFISIIGFYSLVRNWYSERVGLVASFLYVFFLNAPALWGPFAVSIYLSMPFTIFAVLACAKYVETDSTAFLISCGILLSVAGLIRLDCFAVFFVLLIILILGKEKNLKSPRGFLDSLSARIFVLIISIAFPLLLVITCSWATGTLDKMIDNVLIRVVTKNIPTLMGSNLPSGRIFLELMEALPLLLLTILGCIACVFVHRRSNLYAVIWLLVQLPLFALGPHDFYHLSVIAPAATILSSFFLCLSVEKLHNMELTIRFSHKSKHRVTSLLLSAILILLFLPSVYFQALQFPSGNIDLDPYSPVGSYDQTIRLTAYLKSLNVMDGQVLIQYWLPYIYWLTGIKAPSIHLDTYNRGSGIPLEEYERLLAEVKNKKIPYVIVNSEVAEEADPITDFVRNEYFLLKSIGGMDVYSASSPIVVVYDFMTRLGDAQAYGILSNGTERRLDELNDYVVIPRIERMTIGDETQYAIREHPLVACSNITYSNIGISSNATLEFSIAIHPRTWTESGDGVLFEIIVQNNGQSNAILSKYIDPKHNVEDRKWYHIEIPLDEYYNKSISVSFVTNPGPANDTNWDWSDWGNPLIRQR